MRKTIVAADDNSNNQTKITSKDEKLGMNRKIDRRNFIQDISFASIAMALPGISFAKELSASVDAPSNEQDCYPPSRTGLRGSHSGAF